MARQPASPGARMLQALGLTVFLATAAFLTALLVTWIAKRPDSLQGIALVFSTACGVVAAIGMLVDAFDAWMRGRRMSARRVKTMRMLVLAAVVATLAASILGQNTMVILYLFPSMIVYLFLSRRPVVSSAAAGASRDASRASRSGRSSSGASARSRQRRGGRKRR